MDEKIIEENASDLEKKEDELETELENEEGETEVETEEPLKDDNIDFDAELEKERQRLGSKIDKERQKRMEAEKNKGLSREEVEKLIEEKTSQSEKRLQRSRAEMIAERLSGSSAERDLILHHYDNSIISSGNIEEDIEKAFALANRKKVSGQMSELRKAALSKKNVIIGNSGAGAPIENKKTPKYSKDVIDGAKFAGVSPEDFVKKQT